MLFFQRKTQIANWDLNCGLPRRPDQLADPGYTVTDYMTNAG